MGLIYLDTCLLIYAFEDHPIWGTPVREALAREPGDRYAISPLVKLECLVAPMRTGNVALQRYYEEGFGQFALLPMSDDVFVQAATLRARFGLKTPDALHLATALAHRCDALWTADMRLQDAAHGLAVNILAADASSGVARPGGR
ncbi:type II toxin-antitoxin system VapC family toxin [Acidithiobacillus sp. CV18-2]|uniref:Ribonuclease VapC n=1 Tax=Igneacidithiobacillus copahuensis TaxID=2724909 RepID=A0AAE2YRT6_9PROT|nr:type II toxin-antitoxin system VapC family toxin [Igneacidithiobacillus copahuensis]MBU2753380.1 type II toxin-antitoxin system VapC family toxin [Acidithiobacillus sp. CV18-3]MBU2756410.1 type II toxin-antitoxin system VapC family toxin [Acidithiobacillus sp. BN09-2]MBU2776197.1 type II toxin-antitoxin system VapC family toxin [Acidithiobacillus sp. CV18-2]MBU2795675.1 type II toxin-antitoxin system VapC family toxin [Acidithiobacillus sp. VAN18-2]MBU2798325.1 type II toxin-antitoxin syste